MATKTIQVDEVISCCDWCGEDFSKYNSNYFSWSGFIQLEPRNFLYTVFKRNKEDKKFIMHHECVYEILQSAINARTES